MSDNQVLVGVRDQGIFAWTFGGGSPRFIARASDGLHRYGRVAYDAASAVSFFSSVLFGYYRYQDGKVEFEGGFELVGDLDRGVGETLVVGLRRGDDSSTTPYGDHIGWLVRDHEAAPRGLVPTTDGGQSMDWCAGAEISTGRFVGKDRVVVVPGAEPGVFVFDTSGVLVETAPASAFGADSGCKIDRTQMLALSNPTFAVSWLAQRRVIDELVGDEAGNVYFFIRSVGETANGERVCWDLAWSRLGRLGDVERLDCVIESTDRSSRLRADLRSGRLVVLLRGVAARFLEARIVLGEAPGSAGSSGDPD